MIYVDESIQNDLGYICTAFVYARESIDSDVRDALLAAGFTPGESEFKSGARMEGKPHLHKLREDLLGIIQAKTIIGVLITSVARRESLGNEISNTLLKLIEVNELSDVRKIYLDQGIRIANIPSFEKIKEKGIEVYQNSDSRKVFGIQLADHAAYNCSFVLRERLLGPKKFIRIGAESGFLDPFDAELGWVIWTDLRRNFFMEEKDFDACVGDEFFFRNLLGIGTFVSEDLPENLKLIAEEVYDCVWVGCIR